MDIQRLPLVLQDLRYLNDQLLATLRQSRSLADQTEQAIHYVAELLCPQFTTTI